MSRFFIHLSFLFVVLSSFGFEAIAAFQKNSTENLREWKRNDPKRSKLLVFVHGFNSSKDLAWGKWPKLIEGDMEFDEYNLNLFGYPSKACRQTSDIRDQGEFLASFLNGTLQKYRSVILVGHSMGGLVILHALLTMERSNIDLLNKEKIKVLTFGTPYHGVEGADWLGLVCDNKQVSDMEVLSPESSRLLEEWKQRFNKPYVAGKRRTPQVKIFAFRGLTDSLVKQASACSTIAYSCELVDGDHSSMVKPTGREHLAYIKLRSISNFPEAQHLTNDIDETAIRLQEELGKLFRFPDAIRDVTKPTTLLEMMFSDKLPYRLFKFLLNFNEKDVQRVPNIGNTLHDYMNNYYLFHQKVVRLENKLMRRIGKMVKVRFKQGWKIYLQYAIMRFSGRSKQSIIDGGNFLNYDITWEDAERVFVELSEDQTISHEFSEVFALYKGLVENKNEIALVVLK